jgi:hypothetical protein
VNRGDEELYCRVEGSDRRVVEAEGVAIQFVTRCTSAEEFIERFAPFATETDIVVPALTDVSPGTERPFAIFLKDGPVVMKGRCEVTEVRPVAAAPGAAPTPAGYALMRLRLREMDAHSSGIHLRLMERRASSSPAVESRPDGPMTPVAPPAPASATTEVSAVTVVGDPPLPSGPETTANSPVPCPETRVPGAGFTLPANPLSDLDAADLASFVELTLLESNAGVVVPDEEPTLVAGPAPGDEEPTLVALPAPAARSGTRLAAAGRIARRAAPYASGLIVGLLFGIALRPGTKAAAPMVCPPPPPPSPNSAPAPAIAPPSTASAPEDEPPILAPRDCVARVTTKPAGAEVSWGDILLGSSPIERAAIPCGSAIVTFRREHYAEVTRTITSERGRRVVVAQRLQRPSARSTRHRRAR